MDNHLMWKEHVSKRGVGILRKLKNFMNPGLLRNIYYSPIYSHLVYGIEVWGSADSTIVKKAEKGRKRQ